MNKHTCFTVQGKPFFSIGGQVHNSSSFAMGLNIHGRYPEDAEESFASIKALGGNTIAIPVCWNVFEPEEGKFNADYVIKLIENVRLHELHAILLWFGTWKNGQMEYVPNWVKQNRHRFKRVACKDGTETAVLSPHCRENKEQDKAAFCRLMKIVKEQDARIGTVIAVQVENEPGIYAATKRDFGRLGEEAFQDDVPEEVISIAMETEGLIHKRWTENGCKERGRWEVVFGSMSGEVFSAHAIACYIEDIAAAGKEVYDIFMYTNAWMDRNGERGFNLAGVEYPCGGAVSKVLPLWYRLCPHLDAISPDIYETEPPVIRKAQQYYNNKTGGYPLYVPESGLTYVNASLMFEAVGKHCAIGYHVFGAESALNEGGSLTGGAAAVQHSFAMLDAVSSLIMKYRNTGKIYSFCQDVGQDSLCFETENMTVRVSYAGMSADYAGWVPMDYHHNSELVELRRVPLSLEEETGRGLLFQISEKEFYLTGHKIRFFFREKEPTDGSIPANWILGQHQAHHMEFLCLEEGHFEDGEFVTDRIRSGDEARHGIWAQYDCGVVHFVLGSPED